MNADANPIQVQVYGTKAPLEWKCRDCEHVWMDYVSPDLHEALTIQLCEHRSVFINVPETIEGLPSRVTVKKECGDCGAFTELIISYEDYSTIKGLRTLKNIVLNSLPADVVVYDSLEDKKTPPIKGGVSKT